MKAHIVTSIKSIDDQVIVDITNQLDRLGINISINKRTDKADEKSKKDYYKKVTRSIKTSDFVIAEGSNPSISLGFEISYAITEKKPVLLLVSEESKEETIDDYLLHGATTKYLKIKKYKKTDDINLAIKYFLSDIKDIIDTKFILIIPAFIDKYLEWNVRYRGLSKAEVTRKSIEKAMALDDSYTQALIEERE